MRDGLMRLLGMGADGPQVELNEEVRAELLEELAMLNAGGMPGGLGGEEGDGDEEEGEGEWEDEGDEHAMQPEEVQGFLQRMAGMFGVGGGAAGAGDEDETGEEGAEPEERH